MAEHRQTVMTLNTDYLRTGERLIALLGRPTVDGLYLPAPVSDETFRDEFGFVFLSDGGIGPFYVSLGGLLRDLWHRHPDPARRNADPRDLLQGFSGRDLAARALALGTYNALSASLWRAAGFEPPDRGAGSGLAGVPPGSLVGMVGYFCPLIEKLTAQGHRVLVLEQAPERVSEQEGVLLTADPRDLRSCTQVLCTASTLVNDSLDELLGVIDTGTTRFELVGPSGSGLPDALFARGVGAVGGIRFSDRARLVEHLRRGESWGSAGRKYQLEKAVYPGLDALATRLTDGRVNTGQS